MSKALMKPEADQEHALRQYIYDKLPRIAEIATKHLTADRVARLALMACAKDSKLAQCAPFTILRGVIDAAAMGLEIGIGGMAYLVPFWNKNTNTYEATLIIGYRGLIKLARRSGDIGTIEAEVVYERDTFEYELGLSPRLVHRPCEGVRGPLKYTYAIATLRTGQKQFVLLRREEVEKIKAVSRSAGKGGPWDNWEEEMWKKSGVRRLCKLLPLSIEAEEALDKEDAYESGQTHLLTRDPDLLIESEADRLKAKLSLAPRLSAPPEPQGAPQDAQEPTRPAPAAKAPPAAPDAPQATGGATGRLHLDIPPFCPKCGGDCWDNRKDCEPGSKKARWRCKDKSCKDIKNPKYGPAWWRSDPNNDTDTYDRYAADPTSHLARWIAEQGSQEPAPVAPDPLNVIRLRVANAMTASLNDTGHTLAVSGPYALIVANMLRGRFFVDRLAELDGDQLGRLEAYVATMTVDDWDAYIPEKDGDTENYKRIVDTEEPPF